MILSYELQERIVLIRVDKKRNLSIQNDVTNNQFVDLKKYLEIMGLMSKRGKKQEYNLLIKKLCSLKNDKEVINYINKEMYKLGLTHKPNNVITEKEYREVTGYEPTNR